MEGRGVLTRVRSAVSALPAGARARGPRGLRGAGQGSGLPPAARAAGVGVALAVGLAALALLLVFASQPLLYAAKTGAVTPNHEGRPGHGRGHADRRRPRPARVGLVPQPDRAGHARHQTRGTWTRPEPTSRPTSAPAGPSPASWSGSTCPPRTWRVPAEQHREHGRARAAPEPERGVREARRLGSSNRDAGDAAMLKSVQLQGEGLRTAVRQNFQSYAARQAAVVNLSQQYGLNTSAYEQSVSDFAAIAAALEGRQDERAASVPEAIKEIQRAAESAGSLPPITFEVVPDSGAYGDLLSLQGTVRAPAGTEVTVFSDGRPLAGVVSGGDGRFAFPCGSSGSPPGGTRHAPRPGPRSRTSGTSRS